MASDHNFNKETLLQTRIVLPYLTKNLLVNWWNGCEPQEVRKSVEIPDIELVVKRTSKTHANKIACKQDCCNPLQTVKVNKPKNNFQIVYERILLGDTTP